MKYLLTLLFTLLCIPASAMADYPLTAEWQPPVITEDHIATEPWMLAVKVAQEELGYVEGPRSNQTKYGYWFSKRDVAWCAEFVTWCVNEADTRYGTQLMGNIYPYTDTSKKGVRWFTQRGRFISDTGVIPDGKDKQWLIGTDHYMQEHAYIPSPGDYVWFFYGARADGVGHTAIIEGVSRDEKGKIQLHVIEGNNPDRVQRAIYPLEHKQIYGFGTPVRRAYTNVGIYDKGDDVQLLESLLVSEGLMKPRKKAPAEMDKTLRTALRAYQRQHGLEVTGVWDLQTRTYMEQHGLTTE